MVLAFLQLCFALNVAQAKNLNSVCVMIQAQNLHNFHWTYLLNSIEVFNSHLFTLKTHLFARFLSPQKKNGHVFPQRLQKIIYFGIFSAWNTISVKSVENPLAVMCFRYKASATKNEPIEMPVLRPKIVMVRQFGFDVSIVNLEVANEPCK